ncbi:MAG: UDP-N-acetylmuramate dehydrogenase [Candidatus Omnitrophica bacterium]|nr:UDP-N-acetylmuramate dehydrogenase [Candidatus Omnitrophota bacterium]
MNWWKGSKVKINNGVALSGCTTFKIGGRAEFFCRPKDEEELKLLINLAKRYKIKFLVIGAGSNILVSDKGVKGLVVRLGAPDFKRISLRGNLLTAGSGCSTGQLLQFCARHNLSGLEFLAGIPGTLGGNLAMNAGTRGDSIGASLISCRVMDASGRTKTLKTGRIKFGYRSSSLADYIILEVRLRLTKMPGAGIRERLKEYMDRRRATQDLTHPSAGCVFKNPEGDFAGRLIDACGLKGKRVGGASISKRHANFIVNLGKARSADVLKLMGLAKREVKRKFNIALQPEIKIWN